MKNRFCAALLLAAFCVTLFTGCASVSALNHSAPDTTAAVPAASPSAPSTLPAESKRLSKEEARDIALQHAGLSAADVSRLKVEFDYDDGRPEYDVDFHHGGYEYDYEIHAETGEILKTEKDRDD